jgi:holin-like protein
MLKAFVLLVLFQFGGEAGARLLALPVPGPVLGAGPLGAVRRGLAAAVSGVEGTADLMLRHLSLLFVPAGVGVLQHGGLLRREWLPLLGVLVLGTAVTLVVTALVFVAASRMVRQSVREERP